jgi:hypothetical protein
MMNHQSVSTSVNSMKSPGGYRSRLLARYQAFLEKHNLPKAPSRMARFAQGLLSFSIFFGLFFVILTAVGLVLSWLNSDVNSQKNRDRQTSQSTISEASAGMLPSPPAQPAGHAEVKSQSAGKNKTGDK